MTTFQEWIQALTIFAKYPADVSVEALRLGDGEIWVTVSPDVVSDEDKKALADLGFHPSFTGSFFYVEIRTW